MYLSVFKRSEMKFLLSLKQYNELLPLIESNLKPDKFFFRSFKAYISIRTIFYSYEGRLKSRFIRKNFVFASTATNQPIRLCFWKLKRNTTV